jgi:hypothetical protein
MGQNTEQRTFWAAAKRGWVLSIVVGLAVLFIRFRALVPLVWQILEKNGAASTINKGLGDAVLLVAAAGAVVLFVYAMKTGYRKANQALELNSEYASVAGSSPSGSSTALRVIGRVSFLINAPVLYWAAFVFVLLPQLVKIPNASLRIGTTAALAGAFIAMVVIVVVATHIGLSLTKFSFRSLRGAPEPLAPAFAVSAVPNQALAYAYAQQPGYPMNPQMPVNQPNPYGQQGGYYAAPFPGSPAVPSSQGNVPAQQLAYLQSAYTQQPAGYPADPRAGTNSSPGNQAQRQ